MLDVALSKIGDKGLFTKELETALLDNEIDLAVHSMKDLPTKLPAGLKIGCITQRENPQDVLISPKNYTIETLPAGAKVGTSSLRRRSQLLNCRSDLQLEDLRGNLLTRMKKMHDENFDAIVLAAAGVIRLEWQQEIAEYISTDIFLPAVGQGALGLEIRAEDVEVENLLQGIHDADSARAVLCERALLAHLEGGCQIPIGALAKVTGDIIYLQAMVASLDGKILIKDSMVGTIEQYAEVGIKLAKKLLEQGAEEVLKQVRQETDEFANK